MRLPISLALIALGAGCNSSGAAASGADAGVDLAPAPDLAPPPIHRAPPRAEPAFGYHADYQKVVMFGGDDGMEVATTLVPNYHDDTWIYDVAANAWGKSAATGPSARGRAAFAMDTKSARLLVAFGRFRAQSAGTRNVPYTLLDDTWGYDLAGDKWIELTPSSPPPGRAGAVAVYDAAKDRMVMFGGNLGTAFNIGDLSGFKPSAETWQLVSWAQWQRVTTRGTAPSARYLAAAALDTKRNRMVVVGGCCDNMTGSFLSDAWALDLATDTWSQLAANGDGPTNRLGHGAAYDAAGDRVLVFGGHDDGALGNVNDVWALDGSGTWTTAIMGDAENNTMLGCAGNKTEQPYDFVTPAAMSPERRERQIFVPIGDRIVLSGGEGDCAQLDDTWAIAGSAWVRLIPPLHGESCLRHGDQCACLCQ